MSLGRQYVEVTGGATAPQQGRWPIGRLASQLVQVIGGSVIWACPGGSGDTFINKYDIVGDTWTAVDTTFAGAQVAIHHGSKSGFFGDSGGASFVVSSDGLATFTRHPIPVTAVGAAVAVPFMYLADGSLIYWDAFNGYWYSADDGANWTQGFLTVSGEVVGFTLAWSMTPHPTDANRFCLIYEHDVDTSWRSFTTTSKFAGGTFTAIDGPADGDFSPSIGAVPLWLDDTTTNGVLVVAVFESDGATHFYVSTNSGASWAAETSTAAVEPLSGVGFDDYAFFGLSTGLVVRRNPDTTYDTFNVGASLLTSGMGMVVFDGALYIVSDGAAPAGFVRVDDPKTVFTVNILTGVFPASPYDGPMVLSTT